MVQVIILRDDNASLRPPRASPDTRTAAAAPYTEHAPGDVPYAPSLEIADLSAAQLRSALRDPSVICTARAMPTRLIAPEPMDDIRPDEAVPGWGIAALGATRSPFDGAGVRLAVLDTGVDAAHPAFAGVTLIRQDFAGSGDHDANGHGTHCTGTILGRDVAGTRIGVAPGVTQALIAKVLRDDGLGTTGALFRGMLWARQEGAQVIALSLCFDFAGFAETLVRDQGFPAVLANSVALEGYRMNLRLFESLAGMFREPHAPGGGAVVVAAGGNDSRRTVSPEFEVSVSAPAAARHVLSVGALGPGDAGLAPAPFSNTLPSLAAPGVGIVSAAAGGGLCALNGTSMAGAHVAGAAALWWQAETARDTAPTAESVIAHLRSHARSDGLDPKSDPTDWGAGLVQAP